MRGPSAHSRCSLFPLVRNSGSPTTPWPLSGPGDIQNTWSATRSGLGFLSDSPISGGNKILYQREQHAMDGGFLPVRPGRPAPQWAAVAPEGPSR